MACPFVRFYLKIKAILDKSLLAKSCLELNFESIGAFISNSRELWPTITPRGNVQMTCI